MFKDGRIQYVEPFSKYQNLAQLIFLKEAPKYDVWEKTSYFLNKEGEIKFKLKFKHGNIEQLSKYRDDIFVFENIKDDEHIVQLIQVIDKENKILHEFDWIEYGEEERTFAVEKDGKYGFIDINGNLFIDCKYDDYMSFDRQIARVQHNNKWYAINKKEEMIETDFINYENWLFNAAKKEEEDESWNIWGDTFVIKNNNGKYGLVNYSGEIVLDFMYDFIKEDDKKYHLASKNGKWGYIENSPEPKELFDFRFEHKRNLGSFIDGFASVFENETHEIINTQGKILYSSTNEIFNLGNGLVLVEQGDEYKLIDVKKFDD